MEIDLNKKGYYKYNISKERTKERLNELKGLGFKVIGDGTFGLDGILSGLFIERVWNNKAHEWKDYIDWCNRLIKKRKNESNN
tara:strand:+ start:359 stop:607 length:249 start_codon:yes stop_codon:yes gene_type:complete